jgi:hypothetical protein
VAVVEANGGTQLGLVHQVAVEEIMVEVRLVQAERLLKETTVEMDLLMQAQAQQQLVVEEAWAPLEETPLVVLAVMVVRGSHLLLRDLRFSTLAAVAAVALAALAVLVGLVLVEMVAQTTKMDSQD